MSGMVVLGIWDVPGKKKDKTPYLCGAYILPRGDDR